MTRVLAGLFSIALAAGGCESGPKTVVRDSVPDVFFVARLAVTGVITIDGPLFEFPFDASLEDQERLLLLSIDAKAVAAIHPRATSDLTRIEAIARTEPDVCDVRFEDDEMLDLVAEELATFEELDPNEGSFSPPDDNVRRALERVRIRVPLETTACPRFAGDARVVVDATDIIDITTGRDEGFLITQGGYASDTHVALMNSRGLLVYDLDAPQAPTATWSTRDELPRSSPNNWIPASQSLAFLPSNGSADARLLVGASGTLGGEREDFRVIEVRLDGSALHTVQMISVPVGGQFLAADASGAWAGGGPLGSVTSTAVDRGAEQHIRSEPIEALAFVEHPIHELAFASSNIIRLDRIEPSASRLLAEFSELDRDTGIVTTGSTRDGSGLFFTSETTMLRLVDDEWRAYTFLASNLEACPALVRDECGRASPGVGFDTMVPVGESAAGFLVQDCSGALVIDPELDCGTVITVPASLAVEDIDARGRNVLIVGRGALAWEAELVSNP